jgi:hypothetical protein
LITRSAIAISPVISLGVKRVIDVKDFRLLNIIMSKDVASSWSQVAVYASIPPNSFGARITQLPERSQSGVTFHTLYVSCNVLCDYFREY